MKNLSLFLPIYQSFFKRLMYIYLCLSFPYFIIKNHIYISEGNIDIDKKR